MALAREITALEGKWLAAATGDDDSDATDHRYDEPNVGVLRLLMMWHNRSELYQPSGFQLLTRCTKCCDVVKTCCKHRLRKTWCMPQTSGTV